MSTPAITLVCPRLDAHAEHEWQAILSQWPQPVRCLGIPEDTSNQGSPLNVINDEVGHARRNQGRWTGE